MAKDGESGMRRTDDAEGASRRPPCGSAKVSGDRDEGSLLASSADEAPVACTEERVGLGCRGGDFAEDALEVAVAFAGLAGFGAGPGLDGLG